MTDVRVHVRRLVLDGFELADADARAVRRAVEAELGRLLSDDVLPTRLQQSGATTRMRSGALQVGAWRDPHDLGAQVARSLHTGFCGEPR